MLTGFEAHDLRVIASRRRRRIVVFSLRKARSNTSCFVRSHCAKIAHRAVFACSRGELRSSAITRRTERPTHTRQPTKKGHLTMSFSLVAGRGFEPPDLRVMSPTSYQAALPRDIYTLHPRALYYSTKKTICQHLFKKYFKKLEKTIRPSSTNTFLTYTFLTNSFLTTRIDCQLT